MVKFSALGQAKSFQLEKAQELISSRRGFHWHSFIINRLKETLLDDDKLSRAEFAYFVSIRSSFVFYHCEDNLVIEHYCPNRFRSQVLLLRRCNLLGRYTTRAFRSGGLRQKFKSMIKPTMSGQDKLLIRVCEPSTEKVIELSPEGTENIMDILDAEHNPTEWERGYVNLKEELAHVPLPSGSQCFRSIQQIPSFGKDSFNSELRLDGPKDVCSPNNDKVESIHRVNAPSPVPRPQRPLRAPQWEISILNTDALIKDVDKNAVWVFEKAILDKVSCVDVTPLESKVEGLTKQACNFKDLQHSYSGRTSAEEYDSCHMELQGKLDEASHRLNTEGAHYKPKAAELKQVESTLEELLKELQLLEDQRKDLNSQEAASEHLLQETE
ncbi:hypothetical protein Cgig2_009189 [Carnegiea gigantea]|uniref:Uncharacterized protein n=1 Tax=Carnegiea gigantea TaxID=171969 RepID=A0A9Q1KF07_9CARY|nr:hypothetical protein Cgig2_009189 [Carnegiea gigantea]